MSPTSTGATMTLSDKLEFETKILERIRLGVTVAISNQLLHGVRIDSIDANHELGSLRDRLVMRIRAHVWSDPERDYHKTHTFTYAKAHPTWKHHLVASLPEGSFRRGWCHYFWGIPFDYANTLVTEKVEVHVPSIFPENTYHYPEHLGRVHHPISITPLGRTEETVTPPRRELAPKLDEGIPLWSPTKK